MDFINGCPTNVHVLDKFTATPFIHYTHDTPHSDVGQEIKTVQRAIVDLRRSEVLCTLVDRDIWLFGQVEHELGEDYSVVRNGLVEGQKDVLQHLLDAIESALAHALSKVEEFTHIAPWTWLYYNGNITGGVDSSIVKLRVNDNPGGALYLLSEITPTTWLPINEASSHVDSEVVLAPRGVNAKLAGADGQIITANAQWKVHVAEVLQLEGINLDEDAEWADVELVEGSTKTTFAWPSRLCLVHEAPRCPPHLALTDATESQIWVDNRQGSSYRDPLAEAEEWFMGSADRKLRAAEDAAKSEARVDPSVLLGPATIINSNAMTSPPFMQRTTDQQAAMSGIYPTPPDGLAHQGQMQLGPPAGMGAATPSVAQNGDGNTTAETLNDTQEQGGDSLDLDAYSMDEVEEDLFGDVGGVLFEENEVGDADFDYFDEPDEVPAIEAIANGTDVVMANKPARNDRTDGDIDSLADEIGKDNIDSLREPESVAELVSSPPSVILPMETTAISRHGQQTSFVENRALSPFGIRERLLPPPVPASVAHSSEGPKQLRRSSSSFAPIIFRDGVDLGAKYANMDITPGSGGKLSASGTSIALPSSNMDKESDDYSDESGSLDEDNNDFELPPIPPWESTRKRKRSWEMADTDAVKLGGFETEESTSAFLNTTDNSRQRDFQRSLLNRILYPTSQTGVGHLTKSEPLDRQRFTAKEEEEHGLLRLEKLHDLKKEDLICVAQLINEQASTCLTPQPSCSFPDNRNPLPVTQLTKVLADLLPSSLEPCDLSHLAMTRDTAPPPRIAPRAPVPPRTGPEMPDIFSLPAPFIRIQRNNDNWEMLPPALSFWEPNGLAAASGSKNVRARAVLPSNSYLRCMTRDFMGALGRAYEGCKLGTHSYEVGDDGESDAGALVELDGDVGSKSALLEGYARACVKVGKELAVWTADIGAGWEGTFVVYILDPFTGGGWMGGNKHLCACFWMLFQSYLERLKADKKSRSESPVPDVVLQILPIELVAGVDRLVVPDPAVLASLAREVYDRCPTSPGLEIDGDGAAAPSILLAPPVPKRIAFQLLADVPAESLLQDGRVLHLAVAMSEDREWMSCVWSDGQGRILTLECFCLRGATVGSVVRQVWQRTGELVGRLRVVWRVFLALEEGIWRGAGLERVWRDVVTSARVGGTTICVTLVKICAETGIKVHADLASGDAANGLATPASTPVAFPNGNGAATGTNSPNVGASDGFGAPLTPAGSESTISGAAAAMQVTENDPDAHLIEVEDESCGMLFKPQLAALAAMDGMANGAIVRKGREVGSERGLLGVSLCWTLQVKPQGSGAVEIGSLRQAEVTLREVLRMYRALSVLTRARGLHEGDGGVLPVHLAVACKGVKGLEGFFS